MLARVKPGLYLPVTLEYFLEMYEQCLQLTEALETALNDIWPSQIYKDRKNQNIQESQQEAVEKTINKTKSESEDENSPQQAV